jgi:hypothetical protein
MAFENEKPITTTRKPFRDMCGRAIKPVRLTSSTKRLRIILPISSVATGLMETVAKPPETCADGLSSPSG